MNEKGELMELRQIKYFLAVAKQEHVTEAAHSLHVAQSAISRQIANLENELGVKLFEREGRNVKLTQIGRIFMEHIEVAMIEFEKAVQTVEEHLNPKKGTIRIGFPNSLATKTLPMVISAFRDEHPDIGFQLWQGSNQDLKRMVLKGEIDLAFISPVPKNEEDLNSNIFFTENMMALVGENHPLAERKAIRLSDLRNESFVIFRQGFALRDIIFNACKQMGFTPRIAFEGEDIDTIKSLVAAGLGVSILPEISLADSLSREVVSLPISEPIITRTVGVITPKHRELAPSEQLFYHFINRFYDQLQRFGQ